MDDDAAAPEPNHTLASQLLEDLVDARTAGSDEPGQLLLGQRYGHRMGGVAFASP